MRNHAESTAAVKSWDEQPYVEIDGGGKLTRARVEQAFSGDLEGEGTVEYLMCYRPDGTASYIGQQQVVGALDGRLGSFVVHMTGVFQGEEARWTWSVVSGSGTGELSGLRGEAELVAPHGMQVSVTFDYELG